jgi:hypothetical protein
VILAAYQAIFRHALAFPGGTRPAGASRLTEDGAPMQFATSVGAAPSALRFVGDVAPPGANAATRMGLARAALAEAADVLGVSAELAALAPLLARLAPETARALLDDPAGAYWIGAAFARGAAPRLRLYVNGSWGGQDAARVRLRDFAAYFGLDAAWGEAERLMPPVLTPLGLSLTIAPGRPARGAIYLRSFGLRLADYTRLAEAIAGPANAAAVDAFGAALLGPEAAYPTPSAVFSVGFGGPSLSADLEFCAHCLFRDDAEAHRRLLALFAAADLDPAPYLALWRHLSAAAPSGGPAKLHSFVGVDGKAPGPTYTLYLKPSFAGADDQRA